MKVKLSYFRPSGKWYADAECDISGDRANAGGPMPLFKIWDSVILLRDTRSLPGLIKGHSQYIILVDVPDHPYNHPTLIVPEAMKGIIE